MKKSVLSYQKYSIRSTIIISIYSILIGLFCFYSIKSLSISNNINYNKMIMGFISFPDGEKARNAAKQLVEKDLVACSKVLDGLSVYYKWEGKLEEGTESYVIIKSLESKAPEIQKFIREIHPYEVFEFIYSKVESGSEDYFNWVKENLLKEK